MMKRTEASARPPRLAEATDPKVNSSSEDLNLAVSAAKGGSPPLSLELQVEQLTGTVARLSKELQDLKATLKDKARDIESLWVNSDLHFDNAKKLQDALKARLQPHSRGPKTEDRITRLKTRLRQSSNLWIGKSDLQRFYGLKRSTMHWLYLTLRSTGEFETMKKAGRVFIRLAKITPT